MIINPTTKSPTTETKDPLEPLGVSVAEAAKILRCSRTTIYELIKDGHLRSYSISDKGCKRVLVHSIYEFANNGGVGIDSQVPASVRIARNRSTSRKQWG